MDSFHFILFMFESSWGLEQSYNFVTLNFKLVSDITFTLLVLPLGMLFPLSFHSWFLLLTQNPSQSFYMSTHCKLTVLPKTSLSKATIFIEVSLWELGVIGINPAHFIVDAVFLSLFIYYYLIILEGEFIARHRLCLDYHRVPIT